MSFMHKQEFDNSGFREVSRLIIRKVKPNDAKHSLEIYTYYVNNTAISFEYEVPSLKEFSARIEQTLLNYPFLVLENNGRLLGYAYAGTFNTRAAYDYSCEMSIYLHKDCCGRGFGKMLYKELEKQLKNQGILNLYACIASPIVEDEYLTKNSEGFHAHLGYQKVGEFHQCGYKFGRWYNMIWMEKIIGEHV